MQKKGKRQKTVTAGMIFRTYWRYAKARPFSLLVTVVAAFVLQGVFLAAPLYLRKLFNVLASQTPTTQTEHILFSILIVVTGIWFLEWLARRGQQFLFVKFESRTMAQLQLDAFEYLLGHSNNFFISNFAGSLTHKVKQYARSFEIILDAIIFQFLPTFLFVLGAVVILFIQNHILGVALGIWSICFVVFQIWVARLRQPVRVERAAADTQVTATLADAISNQATIALFSASTYEKSLFKDVIDDWLKKTIRLWQVDEYIWAAIGLFILVIEAGLMFGAVYFWQRGELTVGDFVLIQAYLLTTFERLVNINRELRGFFSGLAEAAEMMEIMILPHEVQDVRNAGTLSVQNGLIEFKNVKFAFIEGASVLHDLDLTIKPHEKVALVGASGAGKSTITKLLLRLFDISSGSIEIDGQNIAKVTQDSLRDAISFVPQEPILFHRTLMENIRYGRRDATDAEVMDAARRAHCHEFISHLKEGYDTYVGERGVKLSGGERQRVAIARAILKNAPILVLDEATSSLDSESEALIQDALKTLMQGKTVIVIAHRLSTIMNMDRIVVLENGKIAAEGTHQELLEKEGLYNKLWSIQAGGFIPDDGTGIETVEETEG
ncbi:MAG TPA: ABC transporter ATP-binding protein [Candidatus Paceibacterota bacterium]|nr:ABC transporter ATP-binding protein [Candidatus Paceibacterota bacterium]